LVAIPESKLKSPPLAPSEFDALMEPSGPFEQKPALAVATSGGADSMALTLLAHDWVQKRQGHMVALTIDHGLRPESAQEALTVHGWCKKRGIEHYILTVRDSGFGIQGGIQEAAREARYRLLTSWCKDHCILHLLTAHHLGDQAETLFFRLARGSGIDGLACMPVVSHRHGIRLLRPLLSIPKSRLEATAQYFGQTWVEDPTNKKLHYTRNRIRNFMDKYRAPVALMEQAAYLAERFGNIRNLLEKNLASGLTTSVSIFPEGYGVIHPEPLMKLPPDYALRALSNLACTLNGDDYRPRTEKLQRLYEEMAAGSIKNRRTFSGLLFIHQPNKNRFLVCREPKAMEGSLLLPPGMPAFWDRRFHVAWTGDRGAHEMLCVRALGADGIRMLKKALPKTPEKPVMTALPSFWRLEELVAVPHINYRNPAYGHVECKARFRPAKTLADLAFSAMNTRQH